MPMKKCRRNRTSHSLAAACATLLGRQADQQRDQGQDRRQVTVPRPGHEITTERGKANRQGEKPDVLAGESNTAAEIAPQVGQQQHAPGQHAGRDAQGELDKMLQRPRPTAVLEPHADVAGEHRPGVVRSNAKIEGNLPGKPDRKEQSKAHGMLPAQQLAAAAHGQQKDRHAADEVDRRLRALGEHAQGRQAIAAAPAQERRLARGVGPAPDDQRAGDDERIEASVSPNQPNCSTRPIVGKATMAHSAPSRERNVRP